MQLNLTHMKKSKGAVMLPFLFPEVGMHCTLEQISPPKIQSGKYFLLCPYFLSQCTSGLAVSPDLPDDIKVGSMLAPRDDEPWFEVHGHCWGPGHPRSKGLWVLSRKDLEDVFLPCELQITKPGFSLAWITLSDSGAAGIRQDTSGPQIPDMISSHLSLCLSQGFLLRDEPFSLQSLLTHLALDEGFDLIITTGGTGVAPRDITADVTASLVHKRLPGFEQAMMSASLTVTPHAMISRAVVGILGSSLIINLPGSPRGVRENLAPLLPALGHTLDKIHGDPTDCG
jgi:molybdenum cofactor synthesis domain-containing protein